MKSLTTSLALVVFLSGCLAKKEMSESLKTGNWRATIEIQGQQLPFNLEVTKTSADAYVVYLRNASEKILLDEVTVSNDSVDIVLHVFDANIKARIEGEKLSGVFVKNYEKDYRLPFEATYGQNFRFETPVDQKDVPDFSGKYAVDFVHEGDTTVAVGIFDQKGDSVTGTFLTPTGDYRFLEGNVANGRLQLSTFDGNHAYLFYAIKESNGTLTGTYFSGKTWEESWYAHKDENASIPDEEKQTFMKPGYERVEFSFPDVNGKKVSLTDDRFKNKVVILQLSGTWCPNCMDETKFLVPWYEANKNRGVEVLGLAYERKDDFTYASSRVKKMVDKFHVGYEYVIAPATNDKAKASETLPMINQVMAFPTTIFVGKDGKVKKIHTGFSGPGTGIYYDQFIERFNQTVNELLKEGSQL